MLADTSASQSRLQEYHIFRHHTLTSGLIWWETFLRKWGDNCPADGATSAAENGTAATFVYQIKDVKNKPVKARKMR